MRVEKWEFSQLSCPSQTRTRVAWELMRVEKWEFTWEFSHLSCPGQTRTIVAWELMRVEKWEFSHLSCPGQTRTRVAWELIRVVDWKLLSTLINWNLNKFDQSQWELMRVEKWEFSQLSCPGQTRTIVAWELIRVVDWKLLSTLIGIWTSSIKVNESWWEFAVKREPLVINRDKNIDNEVYLYVCIEFPNLLILDWLRTILRCDNML